MARYGTRLSRLGFYKFSNVWCHESTAHLWVAGLTTAVVVGLLVLGMIYLKGCFEVLPFIAGGITGATTHFFLFVLARAARGAAIGLTILIHDYVSSWFGWYLFWWVVHVWFFWYFPKIIYRCYSKARKERKSIREDPEIVANTKKD